MISKVLIFIYIYFCIALWNPFLDKSINLNKDLVDKLTFIKKENTKTLNYNKDEIFFLKKYNFTLDSKAIDKSYVLNVTVEKNLENLKKAINYLEDRGYRALYHKLGSLYYVVIGYFDTLEKALEAKKDLGVFKNIYPVHIS